MDRVRRTVVGLAGSRGHPVSTSAASITTIWPGLKDSELFNSDLDVTVDYRTVLTELMVKRTGGPGAAEVFPDVAGQPALGCFASNRVNGDRRIGVPTQPTALA